MKLDYDKVKNLLEEEVQTSRFESMLEGQTNASLGAKVVSEIVLGETLRFVMGVPSRGAVSTMTYTAFFLGLQVERRSLAQAMTDERIESEIHDMLGYENLAPFLKEMTEERCMQFGGIFVREILLNAFMAALDGEQGVDTPKIMYIAFTLGRLAERDGWLLDDEFIRSEA